MDRVWGEYCSVGEYWKVTWIDWPRGTRWNCLEWTVWERARAGTGKRLYLVQAVGNHILQKKRSEGKTGLGSAMGV